MTTDLGMCRDLIIMIPPCLIELVDVIRDPVGLVVKNNASRYMDLQHQDQEATLYHQKVLKDQDIHQDVSLELILNCKRMELQLVHIKWELSQVPDSIILQYQGNSRNYLLVWMVWMIRLWKVQKVLGHNQVQVIMKTVSINIIDQYQDLKLIRTNVRVFS